MIIIHHVCINVCEILSINVAAIFVEVTMRLSFRCRFTSRCVHLCVLSVSPPWDLQAQETGDSESEREPHPAAALRSGPAQSPADPQLVWEPVIRVPSQTGSLEAPGPAGPVPQQDPERPLRGFRTAGHRDQPQPEPGKAGLGFSSERSWGLCHPVILIPA